MIQDIYPHKFYNEYKNRPITPSDFLCIYKDNKILLFTGEDGIELPTLNALGLTCESIDSHFAYLFSIDEDSYYTIRDYDVKESQRWNYTSMIQVRDLLPMWKAFACAVGEQLNRWYDSNRFCGCCGSPLSVHDTERAFVCEACNHVVYPVLSPSVIVAITNGNKILLTKYAGRNYKKYALVAGYTEIGETLEQTVEREVLEEVGLGVKNIRYYKCQPWPFTNTLLAGYFAELDGSDKIVLQESELSEAVWFEREEIPENHSVLSLTNEMIEAFRKGEVI